jgi:hypothetical protein
MNTGLRALADLYEENGIRIARSANAIDGINRSNAETAAHCFAIASGLRAASCDTHPKDGDVEQAPLVSGAVGSEASETPNPFAGTTFETRKERALRETPTAQSSVSTEPGVE